MSVCIKYNGSQKVETSRFASEIQERLILKGRKVLEGQSKHKENNVQRRELQRRELQWRVCGIKSG